VDQGIRVGAGIMQFNPDKKYCLYIYNTLFGAIWIKIGVQSGPGDSVDAD